MKLNHTVLSGIGLFFLVLTIMSCKKNEQEVNLQSEGSIDFSKPIEQMTAKLVSGQKSVNVGYYEYGIVLQFKRKGRITQLGVNLPDDDKYTVSLWRMTDSSRITSVKIKPVAGQSRYVAINPVAVNEGEEFMLTVYANDWHNYYNSSGTAIYPIDLGDLVVTGYGYKELPTKTNTKADFPEIFISDYCAGLVLLKFE